jgi:hypothetical protein
MKKLLSTGKDQPLVAHIWGKNPENFYKTACRSPAASSGISSAST